MSKITGIFLVGLPGVGKSTYLQNFRNICYNIEFPSYDIISTDNYIEEKCKEAGLTYSEGFQQFIKEAEADMWKRLTNPKRSFYIDRTNLTVHGRKKIMDFVRNNFKGKPEDLSFDAIVFRTEDDLWKEQLNSRPGKVIPDNVLESMAKSFVEPTYDEGLSYITLQVRTRKGMTFTKKQ